MTRQTDARGLARLVFSFVLLPLLFACSGGDDAESATAGGGAPPAAKSKPTHPPLKPTVRTDDLPDDFPSDLPLYPGAKTIGSVMSGAGGTMVNFESADASEKVYDFYRQQLEAKGWELQSDVDGGSGGKMISATKSGLPITIAISPDEGKTQITVMLGG